MQPGDSWDDYAYFLAVVRRGGLLRAASALGVSQTTLSRRMRAFETALGRRLFRHGAAGYALTPEGEALAEKLRPMEAAANDVDRWRGDTAGPVRVRISAGTWTSLALARGLTRYWRPDAVWLPEFIHCETVMDLARREIDIGVRNARPDQPWLAFRAVGHVDWAVYAADPDVSGWIGMAFGTPSTRSARWVAETHGDAVVTRANTPHLACALARAGVGRVILPTFVGEEMEGLVRLSGPVADLRHGQWLVSHQDGRHEPAIRAALDALAGHLEELGGLGAPAEPGGA